MKKSSDRKDTLERFIRDHREAFDLFEPGEGLWQKIEGKLAAPETIPLTGPATEDKPVALSRRYTSLLFGRAVAACLILGLVISCFLYLDRKYGVTRDPKVAFAMPAYAEEFNRYTQDIHKKRAQLSRLTSHNPELYREFSADLGNLEKSYRALRSDLSRSPDRQALVKAMVSNLQWQIDLLNRQLQILEQLNEVNDEKDPEHAINI